MLLSWRWYHRLELWSVSSGSVGQILILMTMGLWRSEVLRIDQSIIEDKVEMRLRQHIHGRLMAWFSQHNGIFHLDLQLEVPNVETQSLCTLESTRDCRTWSSRTTRRIENTLRGYCIIWGSWDSTMACIINAHPYWVDLEVKKPVWLSKNNTVLRSSLSPTPIAAASSFNELLKIRAEILWTTHGGPSSF